MKVLITGGFGYLGSFLADYFFRKNFEVYILEKNVKPEYNSKYIVIEADICDLDILQKKLDFEIDYCIHTAAAADYFVENYYKLALNVNTLGTRNLIEVLRHKQLKKFIYISTIHIYGAQNTENISESLLPNPINDYALTHLFAEYYVKQYSQLYNFPYVIFRLSNSYAAPLSLNSTKWYLVINDMVKSAFEKNKIILNSNGNASRDFIWQKNVAQIIEKTMYSDKAINDTYNLASEKNYSVLEIAGKVQKVFNEKFNRQIPVLANSEDENIYSENFVSCEKLKSVIDYKIEDKIEYEIEKIIDLLTNNIENNG